MFKWMFSYCNMNRQLVTNVWYINSQQQTNYLLYVFHTIAEKTEIFLKSQIFLNLIISELAHKFR